MIRIEKRGLRICAVAVALVVSIITYGIPNIVRAAESYKFAASPTWYGHVPVMVAIEKGFFADEGLDVEFTPIFSSSDRIAALSAGSVAFSNLGRVAVIAEMSRGNDEFYYVANIDDSPGSEGCWAREGIDTVAKMKGTKVAAQGSAEITMTLLLKTAALSQKDISLVNIPGNEMAPALSRGDIDVACVWQPLLDGLKAAVPDGHLIGTDKDTDFFTQFKTMAAPDIIIMRRDLVDSQPDVAAKIVKAMFRGADFATAYPGQSAELVSKYFNKPASDLVEPIRNFHYYGTAGWKEHFDRHSSQMQALSELLFELGKIGQNAEVSKWANTEFIE